MRIGLITTYFYPFKGGAEANAFFTAKELSKRHEIHIFTSDRKDNEIIAKKEEKIGNIHIHRSKTFFRYGYYLAFYPSLVTNLLRYDLNIVHVHSVGFLWHDLCILIKKIVSPKTKFVITPHGPMMAQKNYPLWQKLIKFLVINFEKPINKIYDKIIQVNPYQKEWLTKEYNFNKKNIVYIPNGIEKSMFQKSKSNKFNNLKNKFIISYIGRLSKYKGIQDVLKILPDIIKVKKSLLFVIIGQDAGYYNELKKIVDSLKINNHVLFLKHHTNEDRDKILEMSEIFIMPSEWEAFGIAILEAMAKENAVISTKTEGGKFLIEKDNDLIYNFGDEKELKKNILKLILDNNLRNKIQKENIKKAKEFTWNKIAKSLEEEYKKCFQ